MTSKKANAIDKADGKMKAKKGLNSKPIILDELGEVRIWFK